MKHIGGYFIFFYCQRVHRVRVHTRVHKVRCTCVHVQCTEMPCTQSAGSIKSNKHGTVRASLYACRAALVRGSRGTQWAVTSTVRDRPHCMGAEPRSWEVRGVHSEPSRHYKGRAALVRGSRGTGPEWPGTIKAEPSSLEVLGVPTW